MGKKIILLLILVSFSACGQHSKLDTFKIFSTALNENREISVYIPKNFEAEREYNIIYCTDGQFINEQYKNKLDSLIDSESIEPIVIIGIHSNEKEVSDSYFEYRNYEYLESLGVGEKNTDLSNRFKNHLAFFIDEVPKEMENKYHLKVKNEYFYGVSNGAGFGISLASYYPDLFKKYILYSVAGAEYENLNWQYDKYPNLIIAYGDKENESLIENIYKFSNYLNSKGYEHILKKYEGGHKRNDWLNQFIEDIKNLN